MARLAGILFLLASCAAPIPMPDTRVIELREIRYFKDDEFTHPEKAFRLSDLFRVQLTEELIRRKFDVAPSRAGLTVSFTVYHDLIRGDTMLSEAQVWVDGKRSIVIRHNTAIADGKEAAVARLAAMTVQEFSDTIEFRR